MNVLACTAVADHKIGKEVLKYGVPDYLIKPVNKETLVERFRNNVAMWVKVFSCLCVRVFECSGANILKLINLTKYFNTVTLEHCNT